MPSDDAAVDRAAPRAGAPAAATVVGRAGRVGARADPAAPERASPPWAVAALVAANAVPLLGVLFWGWSTYDLMLLYWFENGVIGLYTALRMLLTEGPDGPPRGLPGLVGKLFFVAFFSFHYGAFWSVHGFFVVMLFGAGGVVGAPPESLMGPFFESPFGFFAGGLAIAGRFLEGGLLLTAMGLVVSHGLSFVGNVLQRGEDLRTAPTVLMARPYGRVVVLHVTLVLGAFLVMALGEPLAALALFVVLKTAVDLTVHVRAHRSRPAARAPAGGSARPAS